MAHIRQLWSVDWSTRLKFTDHLNRTIFLPNPPQRIISLVPSQTELLVDLGLEERIVGVTKFCVRPAHLRKSKAIVGGTKNYRFEVIDRLKPDLIIGNKEENEQAGIQRLASRYPVWMSVILDLNDSMRMISDLGQITGKDPEASAIVARISAAKNEKLRDKGTCVYLIWDQPRMVVGKNTFIDSMLSVAGFENLIHTDRYPAITDEELVKLAPANLLLSSEPFPFKDDHLKEYQKMLPNTKVCFVDGEAFSWFGSRIPHALEYFRRL